MTATLPPNLDIILPSVCIPCKSNIEMAPLCKIEMTLPRVWGPGRCVMAVLSMSKQEFSRLDVLLRVQSGRLHVADACALMGLHRRQVFRLLRGLRQDGAPSLLSKRRGKPSNHRFSPEVAPWHCPSSASGMQ